MSSAKYPKSDSQRHKVYAAELGAAWNERATRPLTEKEARDLAERAARWLHQKGYRPGPHVNVEFHRGRGAEAIPGWNLIRLGLRRNVPWIVLHEMAHLPSTSRHPDYDGDDRAHGWVFCDIYLQLVSRFLGVDNAKTLKAAFKSKGARIRPKRTRTLTDEQRAALAARFADSSRATQPNTRTIDGVTFTWTTRSDGTREYRTDDGIVVTPNIQEHYHRNGSRGKDRQRGWQVKVPWRQHVTIAPSLKGAAWVVTDARPPLPE